MLTREEMEEHIARLVTEAVKRLREEPVLPRDERLELETVLLNTIEGMRVWDSYVGDPAWAAICDNLVKDTLRLQRLGECV